MNEQELQECLMRGYGYRKSNELRGEYIVHNDHSVTNTLHAVETWERDRSEQSSMNEAVFDACDDCLGDGGFDDTYISPEHEVVSDWQDCRHCEGEGYICHNAEQVDMDDSC